jgi:hypothetical protein
VKFAGVPRLPRRGLPAFSRTGDYVPSVHFVERLNNVRPVPHTAGECDSGYWALGEDIAQSLVGGDLYLHSAPGEPSHFGGKILSFRVHRDRAAPEINGRIVFRIKPTRGHKGVATGEDGWGNEEKLVW